MAISRKRHSICSGGAGPGRFDSCCDAQTDRKKTRFVPWIEIVWQVPRAQLTHAKFSVHPRGFNVGVRHMAPKEILSLFSLSTIILMLRKIERKIPQT